MKAIASGGVWIIIPVHNRRTTTLRCLAHLQSLSDVRATRLLVVDCGSTDETAIAVQHQFREATVLKLSADVWWTGAIAAGMRFALDRNASHCIWLNDDTLPEPHAITALVAASDQARAITGGLCFLPDDPVPGYSGMRAVGAGLERVAFAETGNVRVDALHGNFVCVPAAATEKIGLPDAESFPHAGGDFDYTLRAQRAGIPVLLVGPARARAQPNLSLNYRSWLLSDVPVSEWWRQLFRPGSYLNLRMQWRFHWRHWGVAGACKVAAMVLRLGAISVVRAIVPLAVLRKWRGSKSAAWQHEQRHHTET